MIIRMLSTYYTQNSNFYCPMTPYLMRYDWIAHYVQLNTVCFLFSFWLLCANWMVRPLLDCWMLINKYSAKWSSLFNMINSNSLFHWFETIISMKNNNNGINSMIISKQQLLLYLYFLHMCIWAYNVLCWSKNNDDLLTLRDQQVPF